MSGAPATEASLSSWPGLATWPTLITRLPEGGGLSSVLAMSANVTNQLLLSQQMGHIWKKIKFQLKAISLLLIVYKVPQPSVFLFQVNVSELRI